MRTRVAFALATFFVLACVVSFGMANEGARVLIVAPSNKDATAIRLRDELAVLGFDVVVVEADASTKNLANAARAAGAKAAAQVEAWPPEILLWVPGDGHVTDDVERVSQSLSGNVESELLALRAVELLRGRLIPVPVVTGSSSHVGVVDPPASSAPPIASSSASAETPTPQASTKRTHPARLVHATDRPSAMLGVGMLASPGGLSPSAYAVLSGHLPMRNRLSAELLISAPFVPSLAGNQEGEMELFAFFLGAGIDARLTDVENPFFMTLGVGVGPMLLWFEGQADAPRVANSGARWAALAYGRAGVGYRVHPRLRLRLDGLVGPVFPEPVLRIAGREVASFVRPAAFLSLGVEVQP